MLIRIVAFTLAAVLLGPTAQAQRIELDGGNEGTIELGPSDTSIDRSLEGNISVEIGSDGVSLGAGGSVETGVNGRSIGVSGELPSSDSIISPQSQAVSPDIDEGREPLASEAPDTLIGRAQAPGAGECLEADALRKMHDAFIASPEAASPHYIRRIDIGSCPIDHRPALAERLNADPAIGSGLTRMNVNPRDVTAARMTADGGLEIYTAP